MESLWALQAPKKGTGFDNFTPKNEKKKDSNESKETGDEKKGDDNSSWGGGGGSNRFNPDPNRWENWAAAAMLLLLTYAMMRRNRQSAEELGIEAGHSLSDRELSWHDFLRLLQGQEVVKVVVSEDRQTARIYLKPDSNGVTPSSSLSSSEQQQQQQHFSYEQRRQAAAQQRSSQENGQDHHHPSRTESDAFIHNNSATIVSGTGGGSNMDSSSSSSAPHVPFFYLMKVGSVDAFERKLDEAQRALKRHPDQDVPVQYLPNSTVSRELLNTIPGILLAIALYGLFRTMGNSVMGGGSGGRGGGGMGGIFQIGKSTAKKINKEDVGVTFANVAGCDEAKKEIMEFVDFLKDSEQFTKLGAKIPKGALLCGPPGTGKTLLAKAVAGEAGVPFYSISGSDFIEMFVGVGPSRVRDLFSEARQNSPCIIFIDEIDAVGRQRGRGGMGGNDERENTLNQLLVEMDGFESSTGVVVLAGTNRVDILDQALTRPGRFDRQITVDKPDLKGRKDIFLVHLQGITLDGEVENFAGRLSGLTPGFSGADIANICNEAAIVAARRNADKVTVDDFEKAIDRVIGGLESNKIMSKEERSIVAYHEAGHAVAGWFLEHADPLMKVTIIPRTSGALGFAQYLPKEVFLRTQDQIMDIVAMALAGRAAEEIFFGRVTTGASDDLKRVTELVYSTIQLYGMNPRLGQLSFPKDPNAMIDERPYSEKTAKAMDEEARNVVDAAYERTLNLLREKKDEVESVAKLLLDKETITHDDMVESIGERPFQGDPQYQEFIRRKKESKEERELKDDEEETKEDKETDVPTPQPAL